MTTSYTGSDPQAIGAGDRDLEPGTEVGEYRIEAAIGRGGFGSVYRAVQPVIGKMVAIKVLARKFAADESVVERFVREARAVNQIRHRNIIDIFSFGQLPDGRHYYVMELLDGEPLDAYLRERGTMALSEAAPILRAIARALDAAHAKGIAHRDLKPENIFLARDPDGAAFPKLLDFGIAKLMTPDGDVRVKTGTGIPIGTPYYMSPEQCRGKDVDHRTDIYSFGIVAYRLLTGTYPFDGDYIELMTKQIAEDAEPPSKRNPALPPSVDRAIAWMMRKEPDARPKTVIAGVLALEDTGTAQTTPAVTPSTPAVPTAPTAPALPKLQTPAASALSAPSGELAPPRRGRGGVFVLAGLLVALGAGGAWYAMRGKQPATPAPAQGSAPVAPIAHDPTPPPQPPQPVAGSAGSAQLAPQPPDHVFVQLAGVPEGAVVSMGGAKIGLAPRIQLPYGTREVLLLVEADGYAPAQTSVVPDQDREVKVKMTAKKKNVIHRVDHGAGSATGPNRDDLPDLPSP